MSYTYLQEQGEESSADTFSDIPQFVLSKLNLTAEESCSKDNETASCQSSQFGMMSAPLTEILGGEKLTSFAEDFHAPTSVVQGRGQELQEKKADYGDRWHGLFARLCPNSYLWKTPQSLLLGDLDQFCLTFPKWGIMENGGLFPLEKPQIHPINEIGCGYSLPTPRSRDWKGESAKRAGLKHSLPGAIGGIPNPEFSEWLMVFPIGWTDLKPLGMDKFQSWRQQHGEY